MDDVPSLSNVLLKTLVEQEEKCYQKLGKDRHLLSDLAQGADLPTWRDRDSQVGWMCSTGGAMNLGVDTIGLAVSILDATLSVTRVKAKYLNCMAVTSLYLAVKVCEEAPALDLIQFLTELQPAYSIREVKRMELAMLNILDWNLLGIPSVHRFLHAMLAAVNCQKLANNTSVRVLFERVIAKSMIVAKFKPSLIALAMISLILEIKSTNWLNFTIGLQRFFKIDHNELIACRENICYALNQEDECSSDSEDCSDAESSDVEMPRAKRSPDLKGQRRTNDVLHVLYEMGSLED